MKVYIVRTSKGDVWNIASVCATREIAEAVVKEYRIHDAIIQEWRVTDDINQVI